MTDTYDLRDGAATIVIDDGPYAGVEVTVLLDAPYRVRRNVRRLGMEYEAAEPFTDEEAAALDALYAALAGAEDPPVILAWNVTEAGHPVPVTKEGLHRTSPAFVLHLIHTWWDSIGTVMPPLPRSSTSTTEGSPSTNSESPGGPQSEDSATTSEGHSTP